MPFYCITGTMGGGKSYFGAELCIKYWKRGAVCHTNIDLVMEQVESRGWAEKCVILGDEPTEWIPKIRAGAEGRENLIVIDEGMLLFDAHDWQRTRRIHKELLEFFIWSRKLGLDVYLIGQAQKGMDVSFTRMALQVISCVAVKEIFMVGSYLVTLRGDFLRKYKYPGGQATGRKEWVRFSSEVGTIYKTESTHGKFADVPREVTAQPRDLDKGRRLKWLWLWLFVFGFGVASVLVIRAIFGTSEKLISQAEAKRKPNAGTSPKRVDPVEASPLVGSPTPAPEEKPPARFRTWGVADYGRVRFWEAITGTLVEAGAVYDDAIVASVEMGTRVFKARLDDGRIVSFRPVQRTDYPVKPSWNQPSSSPSWSPSLSPTLQP